MKIIVVVSYNHKKKKKKAEKGFGDKLKVIIKLAENGSWGVT